VVVVVVVVVVVDGLVVRNRRGRRRVGVERGNGVRCAARSTAMTVPTAGEHQQRGDQRRDGSDADH
jgi:hypothetical protein